MKPQNLKVLEDKLGTMEFSDVLASSSDHFKPLPGGSFSGGFSRSAFWFRFDVARSGETWLDIQPPVLDDLRLFTVDPRCAIGQMERHAGDTLPFFQRELPYRGFVFKLRHADEAQCTYYLRLKTTSTSLLIPRLWEPSSFIGSTTLESSVLMASIAVIAVVLLLNVNSWFWLHDSLTPRFMLYLVCLCIFLLGTSGLGQQYLFPEWPPASDFMSSGGALLVVAAGNAFYRCFFCIERNSPLLYWLYRANVWLPIISLPVRLFGKFNEISAFFNVSAMLMTLIGVALSWQLWRRGSAGGGIMFVANIISMTGILFTVATTLGLLHGNFITWNSLHFSAFGGIIALQLAIGARTRSLRDARIQAERDVLHERTERIRQGQFLSMLAHEMRTSLSVLRMAIGRQPMSAKAIASAERAMVGMGDVIERSIQADKLADSHFNILRQPCDVAELLNILIADSPAADQFQLEFTGDPCINTDGKLLRILISNLLDNAAKYAAPGTPIDVHVTTRQGLTLGVCNAVGKVGAPLAERVFEKYYRAPQAHEQTGSGLGLYIARGLAQRLGGTLIYEPTEGRVKFELHLPTIL